MSKLKKLTIGNVTLPNNVILAPMAGVTDMPYRIICREMGAGLICMEMISAKAIYYNNKNTEELLTIDEKERPVSLQLFGNDPVIISDMAKRIADTEKRPFDILDINMGCPVPKVVGNGEGSALMKDPKLAAEIIKKTSCAINKPVTAKIRLGFNDDIINCVEMAKILEDAGAAAIALHARTREQYYSGEARWEYIAKVKDAVSIPVIGNGDVKDPLSAKKMLDETGCDGVMIGRAAQGNPWIFKEITSYLETGIIPERPSDEELCDMIMRHAKMMVNHKGEYRGMREMRSHIAWYIGSRKNAAHYRRRACELESMSELETFLSAFLSELKQ